MSHASRDASFGLLIHTVWGRASGFGTPRTDRSGVVANAVRKFQENADLKTRLAALGQDV